MFDQEEQAIAAAKQVLEKARSNPAVFGHLLAGLERVIEMAEAYREYRLDELEELP